MVVFTCTGRIRLFAVLKLADDNLSDCIHRQMDSDAGTFLGFLPLGFGWIHARSSQGTTGKASAGISSSMLHLTLRGFCALIYCDSVACTSITTCISAKQL